MQIHFGDCNNVPEYEALLYDLRIAASMAIRCLICRDNFDLIVQRVMKTFDTNDPKMATYCSAVRQLEGKFNGIKLHHVKRSGNVAAYMPARMGAARELVPPDTFIELLHKPFVMIQEIPQEAP